MRTRMLFLLAAAAATALPTGGCVSRAEYEEARRLNRIANKQKDRYKAEAESLQQQLDTRQAELRDAQQELRRCQAKMENYEEANEHLATTLREAKERYERLLKERKPSAMVNLRILPPQLDKALRDFAQEHPDLVEYQQHRGMVKLKSDFTFKPGSDYVQPSARDALEELVGILRKEGAQEFHLYIAGHTDNMPIVREKTKRMHPDNWYLSVHRAVAVQQILTKAGLDEKRIGVMGFGKHHPIAPNKPDQAGNAKNRRVEIWVVPPGQFLTAEAIEGEAQGE